MSECNLQNFYFNTFFYLYFCASLIFRCFLQDIDIFSHLGTVGQQASPRYLILSRVFQSMKIPQNSSMLLWH